MSGLRATPPLDADGCEPWHVEALAIVIARVCAHLEPDQLQAVNFAQWNSASLLVLGWDMQQAAAVLQSPGLQRATTDAALMSDDESAIRLRLIGAGEWVDGAALRRAVDYALRSAVGQTDRYAGQRHH